MGTRSLTVMRDEDGTEIAVLYRQFDGYPKGHGKELAAFLKGRLMTNGIGDPKKKTANGPNCLAALIVAHFKKAEPGGFYLYPAGTRDADEEYTYFVQPTGEGKPIKLTVVINGVSGPPLEGFVDISLDDKGKAEVVVDALAREHDTSGEWHDYVIYDGPVGKFSPAAADKVAAAIWKAQEGRAA